MVEARERFAKCSGSGSMLTSKSCMYVRHSNNHQEVYRSLTSSSLACRRLSLLVDKHAADISSWSTGPQCNLKVLQFILRADGIRDREPSNHAGPPPW